MVHGAKKAAQGGRAAARGHLLPPAPGTADQSARPAALSALGTTDPGWETARRKTTPSSELKSGTLSPVQKQIGSQRGFWQPGTALPVADAATHELTTSAWATGTNTRAASGCCGVGVLAGTLPCRLLAFPCGRRRADVGSAESRLPFGSRALHLRRGQQRLSAGETPDCGQIRGDAACSLLSMLRRYYPG